MVHPTNVAKAQRLPARVERHDLSRAQRVQPVGRPGVVAELHSKRLAVAEDFDHGPDLTGGQPERRHVFRQRDGVENADVKRHVCVSRKPSAG